MLVGVFAPHLGPAEEVFELPAFLGLAAGVVAYATWREQAVGALRAVAAERAAVIDRQERLLQDVAHELRTPVTIARLRVDALGGAAAGPAEREAALGELDRIARIVERLMLLARAEQPGFLDRADVDVEEVLEEELLRWSGVADRVWRLDPVPAGRLRADGHALRLALDALVENAVQHTEPGQWVAIGARTSPGGDLLIEVSDGGSGIPPEALPRIFDRFARADPSRARQGGGAGLGLSITRAIARSHGGDCVVESSRAGTTFRLRLPGFAPGAEPARPLLHPAAGRG